LNIFHRCRDLAPKIQAPSPLLANSVCTAFLRTPGFNQFDLCRATSISTLRVEADDQGLDTRAAVATSIRSALHPYQRGKQVALTGAIWLVTANNA
jgi:hypothetical protein